MSDDPPTERYPDGFPLPGGTPQNNGADPAATERFGLPEEPAPTERMTAPGAPATDPAPHVPLHPYGEAPTAALPPTTPPPTQPGSAAAERRPQRRFIIALSIIGGLLLVALIALIVLLMQPGDGSAPAPTDTQSTTPADPGATESPEPTATATEPAPTPTETMPPAPPENAIGAFIVDQATVDCSGVSSVPLSFAWIADGTKAWFGVGTTDASAQPVSEVPLEAEFPFDYQCGQPSGQQIYTLTVQTAAGAKEHATITIRES